MTKFSFSETAPRGLCHGTYGVAFENGNVKVTSCQLVIGMIGAREATGLQFSVEDTIEAVIAVPHGQAVHRTDVEEGLLEYRASIGHTEHAVYTGIFSAEAAAQFLREEISRLRGDGAAPAVTTPVNATRSDVLLKPFLAPSRH